jgi:SAM-dependent methyltransferase
MRSRVMREEMPIEAKPIQRIPENSILLKGKQVGYRIRNRVRMPLPMFQLWHYGETRFECPICDYRGPFAKLHNFGGVRKRAVCPKCRSLERHRLQYLVMRDTLDRLKGRDVKMLHFAPEDFLRQIFSRQFTQYETADLFMDNVDHKVDIQELPFASDSYDLVFASHVLEHVRDDQRAIKEIRRILRTGGIAVLPVPIVCDNTLEYTEANPFEGGHVRAPGPDYFDKYKEYFGKVEVYSSASFPEGFQTYIYEDRTKWPTPECPLRQPMQGTRHMDFVPVCHA